jgi:AraC-like DNA-binding protein
MKEIPEKISYERNRSEQALYLYHQYDKDLNFGKHMHYSFEILRVAEGTLLTTVNSRSYLVQAGETILILPNQVHSYRTLHHSRSKLIIFSPDFVPHFAKYISGKEYENPVVRIPDSALMEKIKAGNNTYLNKGYAYELLGLIDSKGTLRDSSQAGGTLMADLLSFIKDHYREPLSLEAIAKSKGYSYTYLSGLFNASFGINFLRFVNLFRVEEATYLLDNSEKSVTEIAFDSGFLNVRSFNREFLSIEKLTPSEYRRRKKKTD